MNCGYGKIMALRLAVNMVDVHSRDREDWMSIGPYLALQSERSGETITSVRFVCLGMAVSAVLSMVPAHSGCPRFETADTVFLTLSFGFVSGQARL
jgi:hypothetical protein